MVTFKIPVENMNCKGGWFTLFLVRVAYLFLAYQENIGDKTQRNQCAICFTSIFARVIPNFIKGILLSSKLMQNIFLILGDDTHKFN